MEFWENTIENRRLSFRRGMVLAVFLFGIMLGVVLVLVSGQNSQAATIDFSTKVVELQKKFPQGKYWNHVGMSTDNSDGYTEKPCTSHGKSGVDHIYGTGGCTCNHFAGGGHVSATQCMGFTNKLAYDVFGNTTWTTISNPNATQIADIRIGDIVRLDYNSHSVFVIGKNGSSIIVGEANYPKDCQINWGRIINLSTANVTYYERAANYDSVMGNNASNGNTGGTTEATTQQATTEQTKTEATTEQKATEAAKPFTGWKKASDHVHYQYYKKDKLQKKKWLTISKKKYYVDSRGYRVTGLVEIGSRQYYFSSKGVLQKKKWITVDGKAYYVGNSGYVLKSQWLYKGSTLVYVKKDGAVAKSEIVKIGSKKYYFNSKGKRSKGFKKHKGEYYYCNSSGVIQKKKWITQKKKTYYLQKSGVRAADQLLKIGKYQYYFNEQGYLVKNKQITYKGIIYKADKKGRCKQIGTVPAGEESTEQVTTEEKKEETTEVK